MVLVFLSFRNEYFQVKKKVILFLFLLIILFTLSFGLIEEVLMGTYNLSFEQKIGKKPYVPL